MIAMAIILIIGFVLNMGGIIRRRGHRPHVPDCACHF
jgi:hypothetical protein